MSNSSEIVDSNRFFGQKQEKSNFSQTCNLLSQFLKEKCKLGMAPKATMNLFPVIDKPGQNLGPSTQPMNFFPGFGSKQEAAKNPKPESAQMTIFYAGQVIVLNDFPADKANEIMLLASKGKPVSQNQNTFVSNMIQKPIESTPIVQRPHPIVSDLPIARKASLTRFLEKRKDRIIARAPYQTTGSPSKPVESKSWLGLAAQSPLQLGNQ